MVWRAVLDPQMALSEVPKWIQLVRKGLKCPNGSLGSSKSSFSFISVSKVDEAKDEINERVVPEINVVGEIPKSG